MSKLAMLPFQPGKTRGVTGATDDAYLEGQEFEVEFRDYSQKSAPDYGICIGEKTRLRVVRNSAASTLGTKRLVTFKTGTGQGQVDGYCTTTAQSAYPVDPWLAAAVAVNDLFYIVVKGPTLILTDLAAGANNLLPSETVVVALTAATSGATTAGRIAPQDLTGATALLGAQLQNRIGVMVSAATTANTNTGYLVNVKKW